LYIRPLDGDSAGSQLDITARSAARRPRRRATADGAAGPQAGDRADLGPGGGGGLGFRRTACLPQPACSRYQSTLRVSTMIAARITNSRPAPSTSALSSDTSSP